MKRITIYKLLSNIFRYPDAHYKENVEKLVSALDSHERNMISPFAEFVKNHSLEEIEEKFTYTFDMNPDTCLEIGWHLYGEDYKRGQFLVKMRQALREHSIQESTELPDHLSHILLLLASLEVQDVVDFADQYLEKALDKILRGLDDTNVYRYMIQFLLFLLDSEKIIKEKV